MITESQIKAALRRVTSGERTRIELRDSGERSAGRLVLIIRNLGKRTVAEHYAVWHRDRKRLMSKLGGYPLMPLAEARKRFREEFAPGSIGAEPPSAAARRRHRASAGTVGELFCAYVAHLKAAGKRSADSVERILNGAAGAIGADRPAPEVEPADLVPYLAEIHGRGSAVMASHTRAYLSAAFAYGMKAEHDYTRKDAGSRWGIKSNPVAAIKADNVSNPRNRFLSPTEFLTFWRWLEGYGEDSGMAPVLRLMLATGQRTEEILRITADVYEQPRALLFWEKTKNGLPHSIPLPPQAVAILDSLTPNAQGLFFANRADASAPPRSDGPMFAIRRFLKDHPDFEPFVAKDIRRTWKTLAGDAGVSKEMRDRLQNHARKSDISARHYDRYDYLAERRTAMAKWAAYLELVLSGEIKEVGQRESNVVPIDRASALASSAAGASAH